jgi:hypothetical protein
MTTAMGRRFRDRSQAARLLAEKLRHYAGRNDVVVLELPRGGVPVACEIARALNAPVDVFLVRKLGVPGHEEAGSAEEALSDFPRFPAWMWRNVDVAEFAGWLRDWNDGLSPDAPAVGFYGLDLYSLYRSMAAVVEFLEQLDPDAAERARQRYTCFDQFDAVIHIDATHAVEPLERTSQWRRGSCPRPIRGASSQVAHGTACSARHRRDSG